MNHDDHYDDHDDQHGDHDDHYDYIFDDDKKDDHG